MVISGLTIGDGEPDWFAQQATGKAEPVHDGFLVPPGLGEAIMEHLRESFAAEDAWYTSNARDIPPAPWLSRVRYRWHDLRERLAYRAFRLLAGYEVPE